MNFLAILFDQPISEKRQQWNIMLGVALGILVLWMISVITLGFNLPLYIMAMLLVGVFIFLQPTLGLPIIILATMWFQRWYTLEPIVYGDAVYKIYPIDVTVLITFFSLIFHHAFASVPQKLYLQRLGKVFFFFFLLAGAYLIRAFADGNAENALAISAFKNYAFYGLLYYFVIYTVRTHQDLKNMLKILLIGGFGIIPFILIGLARGQGLWTEYNVLSTEGVRFLSFPHAFYLTFVLTISLVLFVYKLRPERSSLLTMWIQLVGLLGSLMRHLWAALFATTVLLFVLFPKTAKSLAIKFFAKNAAFLALVGVFFAFIVVVFPVSDIALTIEDIADPFYDRAASLADTTRDDSANFRYRSWAAAQDALIEYPVQGIGFGQDLTVDFDTYRLVIQIRDLHNSLLVILVQMGLIGFTVFAYALWLILSQMYKAWKRRGMYWPYQLAIFSGWVIFMTASFWQPYFETNFTGIFFWIFTGLLMVSLRLEETHYASFKHQ